MKKFKIVFMAILLISVLATSAMLCACHTPVYSIKLTHIVSQNYDRISVSIYKDSGLTLKSPDCSAIINSVEELNAFCDVATSPIFARENNASNGENQKIIDMLKKSDQKFFDYKSLVVLFRTRESSGYLYDFNDYNIDGAELNITLTMLTPKEPVDYDSVMTTFIYVFGLEKSKITGVTQVNVEELQRQKEFDFKYYSFSLCRKYATILKSMEDLSAFDDEYVFQDYMEEEYKELLKNYRKELLAQYDEEFFQDKSVVVIFRGRPCLGLESGIKFCDIVGNTINVTVAQICEAGRGYPDEIEMHVCLMEFDKAKVESVTQINVHEIDEVLPSEYSHS